MSIVSNIKAVFKSMSTLWWRNALVYRSMVRSSLVANILNPLIFLYAFGFGLGAYVNEMNGLAYMAWILPGMMSYGAMFNSSFETTIGAFTRFRTLRTYDAVLATPVKLAEILLGEASFAATKGLLSACGVLLVGSFFGGLESPTGIFGALFLVLCAGLCFGAVGLVFTAYAKGYDFFNYFFTLWVTPNFLFTGVFFSMDRYPEWVQAIGAVLPMTYLVEGVRMLTSSYPVDGLALMAYGGYLLLWAGLAYFVAYRRFVKRMFD